MPWPGWGPPSSPSPPPPPSHSLDSLPHPCRPSVLTLHWGPGGLAWETRQVPTSRAGLSPSGAETGLHSQPRKDGLSCLPVEGSSSGGCEWLSTVPRSVRGQGRGAAPCQGESQPSPAFKEGRVGVGVAGDPSRGKRCVPQGLFASLLCARDFGIYESILHMRN